MTTCNFLCLKAEQRFPCTVDRKDPAAVVKPNDSVSRRIDDRTKLADLTAKRDDRVARIRVRLLLRRG